jgi:hypothetical protein
MEILEKLNQLNQLLILSIQRYNIANPEEDNSETDKDVSSIASMIMYNVTELLGLEFSDLENILKENHKNYEEFKLKHGLISEIDPSIPN